MFEDFQIIHSYTRKQAIEDGVLVDVSGMAKECGFSYQVAMTRGAWIEAVELETKSDGQDETGRLWDVLNVLRFMIRRSHNGGAHLLFSVLVQKGGTLQAVKLKSLCHGGDYSEPVITILLPNED